MLLQIIIIPFLIKYNRNSTISWRDSNWSTVSTQQTPLSCKLLPLISTILELARDGDDHPTHHHCFPDHDRVTCTEADVYAKQIMMWIHCLPDFPHHPFPWVFGVAISWNTATAMLITTVVSPGITNEEQLRREKCGMPETRPRPILNPVIKILHWMLILWKKPNDLTACLNSEFDEMPKSIQQNGSTHGSGCSKKSAHAGVAGKKVKYCIIMMQQNQSVETTQTAAKCKGRNNSKRLCVVN